MQRNGNPRVSVVVPTRNEARNLEVVLPAIAAVRPAVHEIIVVDGNSVDGTIETAQRVLPWVKVITQTRKGKGNAMACGFAAATGDVIVMFDADGSADPAEIPAFVRALVAGADFAKGSRFVRGGGSDDITLLRKTGNAGLNGVANALFGTSYTDLCYGYNAFWADILPVLDLPDISLPAPPQGGMLWGDGFEIETVLNCRVAAAGHEDHRGAVDGARAHLRPDQPAHLRRWHPGAAHAGRRASPGRAQARRAGARWRSSPARSPHPVGSPWSRTADPATPPVHRGAGDTAAVRRRASGHLASSASPWRKRRPDTEPGPTLTPGENRSRRVGPGLSGDHDPVTIR